MNDDGIKNPSYFLSKPFTVRAGAFHPIPAFLCVQYDTDRYPKGWGAFSIFGQLYFENRYIQHIFYDTVVLSVLITCCNAAFVLSLTHKDEKRSVESINLRHCVPGLGTETFSSNFSVLFIYLFLFFVLAVVAVMMTIAFGICCVCVCFMTVRCCSTEGGVASCNRAHPKRRHVAPHAPRTLRQEPTAFRKTAEGEAGARGREGGRGGRHDDDDDYVCSVLLPVEATEGKLRLRFPWACNNVPDTYGR